MIAAATTVGLQFYDVTSGRRLCEVHVPGVNSKMVALNYGDTQVMCLYDNEKRSYIRSYRVEDCLAGNSAKEPQFEIQSSSDYLFTGAVWGPKNESIIISTNSGKVIYYDILSNKIINEVQVHKGEIVTITLTYDYTMLMTGSKDGYAKLLHPETFKTIREFHYGKPVRTASISPLFDSDVHQKFHMIMGGGQDAKDVTTTDAAAGGFEMKIFNLIFGEKLVEIGGHFGPVHSICFSPDGFAFASGAEDGYVHYHRLPPEYFSKRFE